MAKIQNPTKVITGVNTRCPHFEDTAVFYVIRIFLHSIGNHHVSRYS